MCFINNEESTQDFIGEHVNLVGKNRYLSELVIHKITESAIDPNHHVEFTEALNQSLENISLLKNGGIIDNKEIPPLPEKYQDDLDKFRREFSFSPEQEKNFIRFAEDKGVPVVEEDLNKDKTYIFTRLKAQIARNYWKNKG